MKSALSGEVEGVGKGWDLGITEVGGILWDIGHFERNNSVEFRDFGGIGVREEAKGEHDGGMVGPKGAQQAWW